MIKAACLPVVCSAAKASATDIANALLKSIAAGLASAVQYSMLQVVKLINATTTIDVTAPWFRQRVGSMFGLVALLIVPLLMAGTISAILHQDLRRLGRTWLVGLPVSVLATGAAVSLTNFALGVGDAMTKAITASSGVESYASVVGLGKLAGVPLMLDTALDALLLVGVLLIWMELIIRSAAVYIAVFFLPLAFAGLMWPATSHLPRRLLEMLGTLILSKFVIVATLVLGVGALTSVQGANQVLAGVAIILIAAFAPYVLYRMVPVMEANSIGHLEGLSQRGVQGATRMAARAGGNVAGAVDTAGSAFQSLRHRTPPAEEGVDSQPTPDRGGAWDAETGTPTGK